ncbi:ATP-binding protein [Propylenella binzhouense]|uniref:histidine kinase n=1 Tax=Propylenella binzhouense TaxID=2555902 RepID=A0A964T3J2_9HYPH|nr:ATP-binding protein [Propylenella binzhouense]MYZ47560.1 sodium:solute symporter [Propylenella binzhouense]
MLTPGVVLAISGLYLALLFVLAFATDRMAANGRAKLIRSPVVYTLSLTVYCTSWTFYGAVGSAARNGAEFATIYLGPTLVFAGAFFLLRKLVRISKTHRITSIADFISSRYGKSTRVAAIVTLIALVGTTPYIALQLKSVATSLDILTVGKTLVSAEAHGIFGDTAFWVAASMAAFVIIFGTRNIGADEHHPGVVAAIAFESLVKLAALVAVGLFVVIGLKSAGPDYSGPVWLDPALRGTPPFSAGDPSRWTTMLFLAAAAIVCLPRQFQVAVVEVTDERHLRTASWLFPLYMLLISFFTVPIAVAGLGIVGPDRNPDLYVLTVPLQAGSDLLALAAFIGGFSSATSMVIVACIALSIMISNHMVMPLLLRSRRLDLHQARDLTGLLLAIRRVSIVLILSLGFFYYRFGAQSDALAAIGLISFAAAAQLLPAMVGGIYWRGGTEQGAVAGLLAGFVVWAYTLLLPSLVRVGGAMPGLLTDGPFGIAFLRPEALFYLDGWGSIQHALFWSLSLNVGAYVFVSLASVPKPLERLQSALFVDAFGESPRRTSRAWTGDTAVEDLMALARRIVGPERAYRVFRDYAESEKHDLRELVADARLISFVERQLAGSIGAASARVLVSRVAGGETISLDEVITILDETQQAIEYGRQLEQKSSELEAVAVQLRLANARLKEIDTIKDEFLSHVSHELRTPMTSIRSFAEVLLEGDRLSPQQRDRFARIIYEESQRLTRLLDEILDLNRLQRGDHDLKQARIDPATTAHEAVAAMTGFAFQHGIDLRDEVPDRLGPVLSDPDRLKQVLINLVHNAIKFNDSAGGHVRVSGSVRADRVVLRVEDDGPGVSERDRARIFEKFVRGSSGREGSGLGLAISKQILEAHGGGISVHPAAARGAVFEIDLPLAGAEPPAAPAETAIRPALKGEHA